MKAWIQTAIIAVMFFAAHSGIFADEAKPGRQGRGEVERRRPLPRDRDGASGGQYDVLFDDGDKATVGAAI